MVKSLSEFIPVILPHFPMARSQWLLFPIKTSQTSARNTKSARDFLIHF